MRLSPHPVARRLNAELVDVLRREVVGTDGSPAHRREARLGTDVRNVDLDMELTLIQEYPSDGTADDARTMNTHLKHILAKREGEWRFLGGKCFHRETVASAILGKDHHTVGACNMWQRNITGRLLTKE